jgi:ElaB/YqjD/DUF883 family membrane-anchored ribosome-binding protein
MDEPQPTRVTPGVPPGVAADTETVRREADGAGQTDGDAKQQAQEKAGDVKQQAQQKAEQLKQAAPDQLGQAASTVQQQAKENPLPFAVGGALIGGFLLGRISKRS